MSDNLFRQAKQLLETKPISEMNYEEVLTVEAATIPLDIFPQFNNMNTLDGLEALGKMLDGEHS